MRRPLQAVFLAALLVLTPGCMTLMDALSKHPERLGVYGGTRTFFFMDTAASRNLLAFIPLVLFPIDLPLSFALDTLFLPVTIPYTLAREPSARERSKEKADEIQARREAREDLPEVDRLLATVRDGELTRKERGEALSGLGQPGLEDPRVVAFLKDRAAQSAEVWVRSGALEALDRRGETAWVEGELETVFSGQRRGWPAVDGLLLRRPAFCVRVASERHPHNAHVPRFRLPARRKAIQALAKVDPLPPYAARALADLVSEPRVDRDARAAIVAQANAGASVEVGVIALLRQAGRGEPGALTSLGQLEEPSAPVQQTLLDAADGRELRARNAALKGLRHVKAELAIPVLVRALDTQGARFATLPELALRGEAAASAAPRLARLLSEEKRFHGQICEALGAFGPPARPHVGDLLAASQDQVNKGKVIDALGKIGGPDAAAALVSLFPGARRPGDVAKALAGEDLTHVEAELVAVIESAELSVSVRSHAIRTAQGADLHSDALLEVLERLAFDHGPGWNPNLSHTARQAYDALRAGR